VLIKNIITMSLGKRITELRTKKGISKSDLGRLVNVHYSQIGRYERDEAAPSADMLKKLANELGVTTDFLMNGTTSDMAEENIKDKTLINMFNRISKLTPEDKQVVTSLIDAYLFKQEMRKQLAV
jgi:transcriptional regulator with XRE-family HTH domain